MTPVHRICGLFFIIALLTNGSALASVLGESLEAPRTRPVSRFDHDTHNESADLEEACALCHHLFDENGDIMDDESSDEMACRDCHDSGDKGLPKTEAAFHNRCKGCHLENRSGPITCGQCHTKRQR